MLGRKIEIHTFELLVPEPCPFEVQTAMAKLKIFKLQVVIKFREIIFKQEVK
jgi:hypothetical protein